jgi:CheY-specific phosphatase CheX
LPQGHLVSLNMTGELQKEVSRLKLDLVFSALQNVSELTQKRQISPDDLRRLLIRYLIRGAYSAVEVALNSTVSCDENYLAKPDKVSVQDLDMMAVIDVRGDFLNAQIRLAAASEVLKRLASRMLGGSTVIEDEMIESMALELLNLIYGHAKSYLNDKESFQLPAAIPRLVRKDQFDTLKRSTSVANLSILPLVTPMGSIYVEVDIP